jgi:hypothetical protein
MFPKVLEKFPLSIRNVSKSIRKVSLMPYTPRDYGLSNSLKEGKRRYKRDSNYWRRKKFENLNLNLHKFVKVKMSYYYATFQFQLSYLILILDL